MKKKKRQDMTPRGMILWRVNLAGVSNLGESRNLIFHHISPGLHNASPGESRSPGYVPRDITQDPRRGVNIHFLNSCRGTKINVDPYSTIKGLHFEFLQKLSCMKFVFDSSG